MPRRRSNQSEVSATSGAKLAELPTRPSSTPWTIAKVQMLPRQAGGDEAEAEPGGADQERHDDAAPVGQAPHEDAADAEADHQQRVRQRRVGARDAELGLHARQDDGDDVHRAAADRHQQQRRRRGGPRRSANRRRALHRAIVRIRRRARAARPRAAAPSASARAAAAAPPRRRRAARRRRASTAASTSATARHSMPAPTARATVKPRTVASARRVAGVGERPHEDVDDVVAVAIDERRDRPAVERIEARAGEHERRVDAARAPAPRRRAAPTATA